MTKLSSPAVVLAALLQHVAFAFAPASALTPPSRSRAPVTSTASQSASALAYASGDSNDPAKLTFDASLLTGPRELVSSELQREVDGGAAKATAPSRRRIPQRAVPHVHVASNNEAATRAGYIIPRREATSTEAETSDSGNRVLTPLRAARRKVHRSDVESQDVNRGDNQNQVAGIKVLASSTLNVHVTNRKNRGLSRISMSRNNGRDGQNQAVGVQVPAKSTTVAQNRRRSNTRRARLSLSRNPQLDEFLDKPELTPPHEREDKGASRVTFKATKEASQLLVSIPAASLTEYMTQPVSQYSLLSFHDAEKASSGKPRRWFVRRLSHEEAQPYIDKCVSSDDKGAMDESNLFRLAVPLLPLQVHRQPLVTMSQTMTCWLKPQ